MFMERMNAFLDKVQRMRGVDLRRIESLRVRLMSLGFTEEPLDELKQILNGNFHRRMRGEAAKVLASWFLQEENYKAALDCCRKVSCESFSHINNSLAIIEFECNLHLKDTQAATKKYADLRKKNCITPDILLAWANFNTSVELRLAALNEVLAKYKLPSVAISKNDTASVFNRLSSVTVSNSESSKFKVTVLIVIGCNTKNLFSALSSVLNQSWKNLEILILNVGAPASLVEESIGSALYKDTRIKLINMPEGNGYWDARNNGLDLATGDFVALHDANTWAHPLKIELQVRHLIKSPEVIGCVTQHLRCDSDFRFLTSEGESTRIIKSDISSLMFKRQPVQRKIGYWDRVDMVADEEFVTRIRRGFGDGSVKFLQSGPLSIQICPLDSSRYSGRCEGYLFGAAKLYWEAEEHQYKQTREIYFDKKPVDRPFPVPSSMRKPIGKPSEPQHYDVVIASEFRMKGGSTQSNIQEIICQTRAGLRTALIPMYRYDYLASSNPDQPVSTWIWNLIDGRQVDILAYGEQATCDLLIIRYPPVLNHLQRFIPQVRAKKIHVIINQTPMSDYGATGVLRYEISKCAENIRNYFGMDAVWHPIGPLVRDALLQYHEDDLKYINLSNENWINIIDVDGWRRSSRPDHSKLRIGRHSRDDLTKWPDTKEEILAAYPESADIEVHVLGGASAPSRILGKLPNNWVVYEFGSLTPQDFLSDIDVFIYFTNSNLVESFGRVIMEAMAVGVPVVVSEIYRPLFKDAALYATPETAVCVARKLFQDKDLYQRQVERALDFVKKEFGYDLHIARLKSLGIKFAGIQ